MTNYTPCLVDEIVAGRSPRTDPFGLINDEKDELVELYGYEVTLDGCTVVPRLNPTPARECGETEAR